MNADDYQRLALRTEKTPAFVKSPGPMPAEFPTAQARYDEMLARLSHAQMGMASEGGEFAGALKKRLIYSAMLDHINLVEEIGDVLWYLALAADALGVPLSECMRRNIDKLRARYPQGFTEAQALTRDLDAERAALEAKAEVKPLDPAAADRRKWEASQAPDPMVNVLEKTALGLCTCNPPKFVGNMRCDNCGRSLF